MKTLLKQPKLTSFSLSKDFDVGMNRKTEH
nr:MAG TPA: hypothetical protein [Caudoviricetes sp.]